VNESGGSISHPLVDLVRVNVELPVDLTPAGVAVQIAKPGADVATLGAHGAHLPSSSAGHSRPSWGSNCSPQNSQMGSGSVDQSTRARW
jgi:hypothetical protein